MRDGGHSARGGGDAGVVSAEDRCGGEGHGH